MRSRKVSGNFRVAKEKLEITTGEKTSGLTFRPVTPKMNSRHVVKNRVIDG